MTDATLVDAALYQMDVPALSYIYAAYGLNKQTIRISF